MQVFKTFMKVMLKRLHTSMIYIVIFIFIGVAMSTSDAQSSEFKAAKLKISVIDMDNSKASEALVEYISSNHKIVDVENNKDAMLDALYYMSAEIIFTINEGYSEKLANGETDDLFSDYRVPGTFSTEYFDTQINQYISSLNAYIAGGMKLEEALSKAGELAENQVKAEIVSFSENSDVKFGEKISYYYQYLAYILIAVMISGLCPTILIMTSSEIRNRTNCSCVSASQQVAQITAGSVIFALGVYLILTIAAICLYGSQMFNSKGLLAMLNGFVYLLFAMMLTLLIAVASPNQKAVNIIGNVFSLGMSFLCGVFVPQMLLSDTVLNIGKFLPAYWYVKANNMLAGSNNEIFSTGKFMTCIGVELAFSAALFCVVLLVAKAKRKSRSV